MASNKGNSTRFSKVKADAIVSLIETAQCRFRSACLEAGVASTTGHEWLQRGEGTHPKRKPTKDFVEFAQAVRRAEAKGEIMAMAHVRKHMNGGSKVSEVRRRYKGVVRMHEGSTVLGENGKPIVDRVLLEETVVEQTALPDLKAAIFFLSTVHRDRYTTRSEVELNADVRSRIAQLPDEIDDDEVWERDAEDHLHKAQHGHPSGNGHGGNGHDPSFGNGNGAG